MEAEGLGGPVISAFEHSYNELISGSSGNIAESNISPVSELAALDTDIKGVITPDPSLLKVIVISDV